MVGDMSHRHPVEKVLSRTELIARYGPSRRHTLVFTNGCFDLLHPGHISYLSEARTHGDRLVVGVNSDASARRLDKGSARPVVPESDRALVVAALESVDAVCLFDDETPFLLIEALRPDVLVKGADYEVEKLAGRGAVERSGGQVVLIPLVDGYSTTGLLDRIRGEPR